MDRKHFLHTTGALLAGKHLCPGRNFFNNPMPGTDIKFRLI